MPSSSSFDMFGSCRRNMFRISKFYKLKAALKPGAIPTLFEFTKNPSSRKILDTSTSTEIVHAWTMPTVQADSDCEIVEIPLTNHNSNLAEGNGTKDVNSLKRKLKNENSVFELLKKKCKVETTNNEEEKDDCKIILAMNAEFNDVFDRSKQGSMKFRDFINTTDYVFTTPVKDVTTHPKFPKLRTTLHTIVKEVFSDPKGGEESIEPKKEESSEPKKEESSEPKTDATSDGLEVVKVLSRSKPNLPPSGVIKRKALLPGSEVWVMKTTSMDIFVEGTVLSICDADPEKLYKVRFDETNTIAPKLYTAKQLAYRTNSDIIAPVGTRIVARYSDGVKSMLYAGIVAEPPKFTNQERYLIFFDDGYAQYIEHKDVYVVCAQSIDVADDVYKHIRKFIKAYLQKYPERPMLKLQKNQVIKTEYDREWYETKVLDIDGSMVKMYFTASHRTEWIYRGSTRLKPLYDELANASRNVGRHRRHNIVPRRPHEPYVEYTRDVKEVEEDAIITLSDSEEEKEKKKDDLRKAGKPRNTARKSTTWNSKSSHSTSTGKNLAPDFKSHLGYKDLLTLPSVKKGKYVRHVCDPLCRERGKPANFKGCNPFLIPIHLGWKREIRRLYTKENDARLQVQYDAPCGKHLRNLDAISRYLTLVSSRICIDFFTFDPFVVVLRTFRPKEVYLEIPDVTYGKENVPVSCVNSWENEPPVYVEYSAERFAGPGVVLNESKEFLGGCSCTDNCQNPERCECQRITNKTNTRRNSEYLGYKHRRLKENIVTGVYECNSQCKCGPRCGNRVVQNGLQVRLQMFRTFRKGWGIRCLDDLEAGMFICIYAGQILTEQGADRDGNEYGDEYLAELDHIEVAEKLKEDYEAEAALDDLDLDHKMEKNDDDYNHKNDSSSSDSEINICDTDSDFESSIRSTGVTAYTTRSRRRSHLTNFDSSSNASSSDSYSNLDHKRKKKNKELPDIIRPSENGVRCVAKKSLSVKSSIPVIQNTKPKEKITRSFFGEDSVYIMDAKSKGNIGRYLNHSCSPNVFVQNVFVKTHDLRFPEVAFFASNFIQAGTELTWDYNYEVGSVEGKVLYCYCDSRLCRGRLL
ncbi:histone-lysine N-methyltransferase SETDB1-B [Trichonephila inaurata madagascariensis]|uniref:Histone-lysine N-methyltransferase SETDB1-B n=1 Tax=Trichonephila inaurata madagascariensis TaxID=2747483 RepID=A0A8X6XTT4_9ARAC|nr:histone-lysine N-methyltransferase SETDB1-B [Trichonephila inaurata madagascariensis]